MCPHLKSYHVIWGSQWCPVAPWAEILILARNKFSVRVLLGRSLT